MKKTPKKTALIIGQNDEMMSALPFLLFRSGFDTDLLSHKTNPLNSSRYIKNKYIIDSKKSLIDWCFFLHDRNYDWIIVGDDPTLNEILISALDLEIKEKLLPVISRDYFDHVFSKTNLSLKFKNHQIATPEFCIVHTKEEALEAFHDFNKAVMFKKDKSCAGLGNRLCKTLEDVQNLPSKFFERTVLAQEYIEGIEFHVGALYLDKKLLFFEGAEVIKNRWTYGPSCLRKYIVNFENNAQAHQELEQLGRALGAHGFANITCIQEATTGKRYYIEADLRTTSWLDYSKYYGVDIAPRIQKYFNQGIPFHFSLESTLPFMASYKLLAFGPRLPFWQLATNRYQALKYLPWKDPFVLLRLLQTTYLAPKIHFLARAPSRFIERPLRRASKKLCKAIFTKKS